MRREHLAAIGLALIAGCSWTTSSTQKRTSFGYDHPVRVAVMTDGQRDVIDGWLHGLRATGNVEVISTSAPASAPASAPPAELAVRLCKLGRELAAAGTPVDEVVAIRTTESGDTDRKCTKWERTRPLFEDFFKDFFKDPDKGGGSTRYCAETRHVSASAQVRVSMDFLDAATCRLTRSRTATSEPASSATGDEAADRAAARRTAARIHVQQALRVAPTLFPPGLSIVGVSGRQIEVSRRGDQELAPGKSYLVRGQSPGPGGPLGHVRVARLEADRAILEADRDYLGVGVDDELRAYTVGHRWTVYGTLTMGQVKADDGTSSTVGIGAAARWTPERIPLIAEVEAVQDLALDTGVARLSVGPAAGVRWPVGPFAPYAIVEFGFSRQTQRDDADRPARADGFYRGAGGGAELRLGPVFLLGDVRYRRLSINTWRTDEEVPMPTTVPHFDLHVTHVIARVTAGYQF